MLPGRLVSIDAYRGFVMLLLLGEVLRFCEVAAARPASGFWAFLCHHQSHVPWVGASLHDLIQPSFSFLVGTALALSVASRSAAGQSRRRMIGHAAWRAAVLILLSPCRIVMSSSPCRASCAGSSGSGASFCSTCRNAAPRSSPSIRRQVGVDARPGIVVSIASAGDL